MASLDGTLRNAGANLVENTLKTAVTAERQALVQLRQSCVNVSEGIALEEGQPALPDPQVLKKRLELLRKHDALLKMHISTAILEARSRIRS